MGILLGLFLLLGFPASAADDTTMAKWGATIYLMGPFLLIVGLVIGSVLTRTVGMSTLPGMVGAVIAFFIALFNHHAGQSWAFLLVAACLLVLGKAMERILIGRERRLLS